MNFPLDNPFFQFAYWLVNTPSVGGLVVGMVGGLSITAYALTIRWILAGDPEATDVYAYPTPALHAETPSHTTRR